MIYKTNSPYDLVKLAMFLTIALILNFIETFIPIPFPFLGAKLGLTNIVTVMGLSIFGFWGTALLVISRICITSFLFGNFSSMIYSLAGGILSCIVMALLYKTKSSIVFISVIGGITHNLGQLLVVCLVMENWSLGLYYLPYLLVLGSICGFLIGQLSNLLLFHLKKL